MTTAEQIATLEADLRRALAELGKMEKETRATGNLLARIHCDGGHFRDAHGTLEAIVAADAKVVELLTTADRALAAEAEVARLKGPPVLDSDAVYEQCQFGSDSYTLRSFINTYGHTPFSAQAQLERALADLEHWRQEVGKLYSSRDRDATTIAAQRKEIEALRTALEWYAEPVLTYAITQMIEPRSAAHADGGKRARAALLPSKQEGE